MSNALNIEQQAIITISTAHLAPETIKLLEESRGDVVNGPSVAVREHGFFMNSGLDVEHVLDHEFEGPLPLMNRHPDLVLVQAFARGLNAAWVCIDADGGVASDFLPVYDGESVTLPENQDWRGAFEVGENTWGHDMAIPHRWALEMIEAGQTPRDPAAATSPE